MKKIISILSLVSLLAILLLPMVALAQNECCILRKAVTLDGTTCNAADTVGFDATAGDVCSATATNCNVGNKWGMFCIMNTINSIIDWVFILLMAFVGVMIILGAFTILTGAGAPEKVTSGRNYILYAVIGLVVGMFARAIPSLVKMIVGM